jgi:hypothetical protein
MAARMCFDGADMRYFEWEGLRVLIRLRNDSSQGEKSFLNPVFALILFIVNYINLAYIAIVSEYPCLR